MFKLANNGYSMTFENGYTVSVRWHECMNYVSNHSIGISDFTKIKDMASNSVDAEVAVKDKAGNFLRTPFNEVDAVIGWQSPKQVLEIMKWVADIELDDGTYDRYFYDSEMIDSHMKKDD